MHETGIEGYYAIKDGKKLRFGYTTGSCAAAAAKAAATMLTTGRELQTVDIMTPKGIPLNLEIEEIKREKNSVSCAVRKFSGDDPDVTDGVLVFAEVSWQKTPGVTVDGGTGIGRVTKPGLKQKIGESAINPVPMQMIRGEVARVLDESGEGAGMKVVVSIPAGVELAKKTFNPRLGIEGGISVLGTSGIVEPMSEEALLASIELELRQKRALGCDRLLLVPGNYGADFLRARCDVPEASLIKCSNYLGKTLDMAVDAGYPEVLLVGHVGKLIKLAGGIMNSHSKEADARAELMAGCALRAGCDAGTARAILDCLTTDEMVAFLQEKGLLRAAMDVAAERIDFYLRARVHGELTVGAVVYSNELGILCTTGPAANWLRDLEREHGKG